MAFHRWNWIIAAITSVAVLGALPVAADWRRVQGGIRLSGPMVEVHHGMFLHSFWQAALSENKNGPIGIWLDSSGGSLGEALRVGDVIRELQSQGTRFATLVPYNGTCDLACLAVFSLGDERYIEAGARIDIDLERALAADPGLLDGPLVSILADADAQFAASIMSSEIQNLSAIELAANFPEFTTHLP